VAARSLRFALATDQFVALDESGKPSFQNVHQIAVAQFETQIPADAQDHNVLIKMSALEQLVN
jgi:hypothetical protein